MFNEKGQAFDAFKLLIAAVVAGTILVIILGMLQGFIVPVGEPMHVITQSISSVKQARGSGTVSPQNVQFVKGDVMSTSGIADQAGVNQGTVCFCNGTLTPGDLASCPAGYNFTSIFFDLTGSCGDADNPMVITATKDVSGKIRVYNNNGKYIIGFNVNA
ncbi:hypothetical protein K8R43_04025 [archaeon]|nr:hypothetical protein [archaeon]